MTALSHDRRYIVRETGISIAINALLSAAFFVAIYRGADPVPVWGGGGLAFDALPQSFMVGLMGALVPGLLARRHAAAPPSVPVVIGWALLMAVGSVALGGGGTAALLLLSGLSAIGFAGGLAAKVVYGALLAALATPLTLRRVLK